MQSSCATFAQSGGGHGSGLDPAGSGPDPAEAHKNSTYAFQQATQVNFREFVCGCIAESDGGTAVNAGAVDSIMVKVEEAVRHQCYPREDERNADDVFDFKCVVVYTCEGSIYRCLNRRLRSSQEQGLTLPFHLATLKASVDRYLHGLASSHQSLTVLVREITNRADLTFLGNGLVTWKQLTSTSKIGGSNSKEQTHDNTRRFALFPINPVLSFLNESALADENGVTVKFFLSRPVFDISRMSVMSAEAEVLFPSNTPFRFINLLSHNLRRLLALPYRVMFFSYKPEMNELHPDSIAALNKAWQRLTSRARWLGSSDSKYSSWVTAAWEFITDDDGKRQTVSRVGAFIGPKGSGKTLSLLQLLHGLCRNFTESDTGAEAPATRVPVLIELPCDFLKVPPDDILGVVADRIGVSATTLSSSSEHVVVLLDGIHETEWGCDRTQRQRFIENLLSIKHHITFILTALCVDETGEHVKRWTVGSEQFPGIATAQQTFKHLREMDPTFTPAIVEHVVAAPGQYYNGSACVKSYTHQSIVTQPPSSRKQWGTAPHPDELDSVISRLSIQMARRALQRSPDTPTCHCYVCEGRIFSMPLAEWMETLRTLRRDMSDAYLRWLPVRIVGDVDSCSSETCVAWLSDTIGAHSIASALLGDFAVTVERLFGSSSTGMNHQSDVAQRIETMVKWWLVELSRSTQFPLSLMVASTSPDSVASTSTSQDDDKNGKYVFSRAAAWIRGAVEMSILADTTKSFKQHAVQVCDYRITPGDHIVCLALSECRTLVLCGTSDSGFVRIFSAHTSRLLSTVDVWAMIPTTDKNTCACRPAFEVVAASRRAKSLAVGCSNTSIYIFVAASEFEYSAERLVTLSHTALRRFTSLYITVGNSAHRGWMVASIRVAPRTSQLPLGAQHISVWVGEMGHEELPQFGEPIGRLPLEHQFADVGLTRSSDDTKQAWRRVPSCTVDQCRYIDAGAKSGWALPVTVTFPWLVASGTDRVWCCKAVFFALRHPGALALIQKPVREEESARPSYPCVSVGEASVTTNDTHLLWSFTG